MRKTVLLHEAGEALAYALDLGLITWFGGDGNVLKLKPPLVVTDSELERMLELVERTIAFVDARVRVAV